MKGEDLIVLEQTTQLTHKRSYQRLPSQSHLKKLPRRLSLLNESRLYLKTLKCEKNSAVASPREQLYKQMTSNPSFAEI